MSLLKLFVIGLSSCERVHQIIEPEILEADVSAPMEERDHVWVVDQNSVEVPVPGTWVLVSHTHLNSTSTIGESFTLPPDDPHSIQISDGTYTDGEGILWTKIRVTTSAAGEVCNLKFNRNVIQIVQSLVKLLKFGQFSSDSHSEARSPYGLQLLETGEMLFYESGSRENSWKNIKRFKHCASNQLIVKFTLI